MKEPREILLEHHRGAQAQLDGIRQAALEQVSRTAATAAATSPETRAQRLPATRFAEWLLPFRRHLVGLGLAWVLIALLNLLNAPAPAPTQHQASQSLSSRTLWLALREHQRQLREWTQPSAPEPSGVPQSMVPPRRSRSAVVA